MKRSIKPYSLLIIVLVILQSCLTEFEPESSEFDDLLVVEGLITDQLTTQTIKLTRTAPIDNSRVVPLSGAGVNVTTSEGEEISFIEGEPGYYNSSEVFAGQFDVGYQLNITLNDGSRYQSSQVEMVATPEIDSVYAEFVKNENRSINAAQRSLGDFNFYVDSRNNDTDTKAFRYRWSEAYRIKVPNPSRWRWLGGDEFEFRREDIPEDQEEFCFRHDTSSVIIINESLAEDGAVIRFPVYSYDADIRKMNLRYSFEVVQYGLAGESLEYWSNLARISSGSGFLFDAQPGTITGNITSLQDSTEVVLGLFEVVQERRSRRFYIASDFRDQGFGIITQNWVDCADLEQQVTPTENAGQFMIDNNERVELLFFTSNGFAVFGPRFCALCTLYGTNEQPEFWEF